LLGVCAHESVASSQESVVQATVSPHATGVPAWHPSVALQVSAPSQNWPLSQAVLLATLVHASVVSLHASIVHVTESLHVTAVPGWQPRVALQVSAPLQNSPSSHAALLMTCEHESVASLHESVVHPTESMHETGVPARHPSVASHVSAPLQNWPSSHAALVGACTHASVVSLQESTVHATVSPHATGVPAWQPSVALHVSSPSQNWPLSHAALLGACAHASVASLQESIVQATVSAHGTGPA
jgi:hypothetical protein